MCFACDRLGIPRLYEEWSDEQKNDDEEEEEASGPQLPYQQMASIAPKRMTVVESAPSHDDRPTFAAYSVHETTQPAVYIAKPPPYDLLIYDVTPDANPSRAEKMALAIFERTQNYSKGQKKRLGQASRLVIKDAAVAKSRFLPELLCDEWHAWGTLVISCVTERWEEGLNWLDNHPEEKAITITTEKARNARFGTCLLVKWQPREAT
ncbi:hypothetical protein J7T55_010336 [Diaporthe amygdali]|uniref:uncharacterized protein n=1 Tax=Phomopsis amygdali TaxID=1214568 RepID=UPI0022FE7F99|nr:uncharacterized protein J7T55_010336 [Diaporthe amygdali]KAJ0107729.1 hypothetical protein J7T55_010336 [Diaporthe amygdali]